MTSTVNIGSSAEWSSLLAGTSVVVADFYADWCGPCKMIAPHYEKMAKEHARPKKLAFAKVNVDNQSEISQSCGVTAMPTFKVFHNGTCVETIKGANPSALTAAIMKAKELSGGGAGGAAGGSDDIFKRPGRTLGNPGAAKAGGRSIVWSVGGLIQALIAFFGLYIVSLFSMDAYNAAQKSTFNIHNDARLRKTGAWNGAKSAQAAKPPPAFKTMADLGS